MVCSYATVQAQDVNSFKSNPDRNEARVDTPLKASVRWLFGFDTRSSFLLGQSVRIGGLRIGFEIDDADRFGWGFYNLRNAAVLEDVPILFYSADSTESWLDTTNVNFSFGYNTLFYERVLFKNRKWEVSAPFHIGLGSIQATATDTTGFSHRLFNATVMPLEMSVTGQYNILPWLGVGAGLGYRAIVTSDQQVREAYNAPIWIAKVKFSLGGLYRSIFRKPKPEDENDSANDQR